VEEESELRMKDLSPLEQRKRSGFVEPLSIRISHKLPFQLLKLLKIETPN